MKDLIESQKEYIELLEEALSNSAGFLHVHGWRESEEKIQKGKDLREKIEKYSKLI